MGSNNSICVSNPGKVWKEEVLILVWADILLCAWSIQSLTTIILIRVSSEICGGI